MLNLKIKKDKEYNFRKMILSDLKFFNETRNESSKWLHNSSTHTYDECVNWFENNTDSFYYIVELQGEQIGYFRFSEVKNNSVYIGADINLNFRGKGHATKIYEKMFKNLKSSGYNVLYLEVLDYNVRAINLYEKLGFEVVERINILRNNKDTISIKMRKIL